jgi:MGT family glycosyltransferase
MKGRHIAMFSLLNPGHVYPTLGLCSELVRRGHRITYPTTDRLAEKIRQTGAEPLVFGVPELTHAEKIRQYPSPDDPRFWQLYASIFIPASLTVAAATVMEMEGFYRENPPDLIVYDWFSYGGRILAKMLGCPAVHAYAHFAHQGFLVREDGVCKNPAPIRGFAHLLDSFMSAYGIEASDNLWHREDLNIIFVPREFQFDADSFDDRFHFVGPCLNRPAQATWENKSGGKPVLLISESASMRGSTFLRICIEAFADCGYHVVFSVGANTPPIQSNSLPANFEINRDAYNLQILPHAAAIVCQSGMGTALESLYFGVPIVALPNQAFNAEVAYRVAELGLGIHLRDRDVSSKSLRASVDSLIGDTAVRERLKVMQKAVRNCGGAELAANLIEGALNR